MTMLVEQGAWMMDILEEHLEELAWLWPLRQTMLASGEHDLVALGRVERRIAAHADALVLAGEIAMPLLEQAIEGDEGSAAAAAHVLLSMRRPDASELVLKALPAAAGPARTGLRVGMRAGPKDILTEELTRLAREAAPAIAVIAADVLAFRGAPPPSPERIVDFIQDQDPEVRCTGWRLVGLVRAGLAPKLYSQAMSDSAPGVRDAALRAGAWCGLSGVLTIARQLAANPNAADLEPYYLLAALGTAADLPIMAQLGAAVALGPPRFHLLGAYGNSALVPQVVAALASEDPATAAAAGAAFRKLTGVELDTLARAAADGDGDEFEAEFADDVAVPDPEQGRRVWEDLKPRLGQAARICYGIDLAQPLAPELLQRLDLRSHAEVVMRSCFAGSQNGSLIDLERFPRAGP